MTFEIKEIKYEFQHCNVWKRQDQVSGNEWSPKTLKLSDILEKFSCLFWRKTNSGEEEQNKNAYFWKLLEYPSLALQMAQENVTVLLEALPFFFPYDDHLSSPSFFNLSIFIYVSSKSLWLLICTDVTLCTSLFCSNLKLDFQNPTRKFLSLYQFYVLEEQKRSGWVRD